jgi:hypothetical protein
MGDNKVITQMTEGFQRYIADNKDSIQVLISENGDSNFQKNFSASPRNRCRTYSPENSMKER